MKEKVLIIGCGYIGSALAVPLRAQGYSVCGLTRNAAQATHLAGAGVRVLAEDFWSGATFAPPIEPPDIVINLLSAGGEGLDGYARNYRDAQDRIRDWLSTLPQPPSLYLFTSSTRVYHQDGDVWVRESDAPDHLPDPGGDLLREGEKRIEHWPETICPRRVVLRLAGLYGPGRTFLLRQVLAGETFSRPSCHHFLNLLHRDDAASAIQAVVAGRERLREGYAVFSVADGQPARKETILNWLGEQTQRPIQWTDGEEKSGSRSPSSRSGRRPSRRMAIDAFREAFGWSPAYPDFRAGYGELVQAQAQLSHLSAER